MSLFPRFARLTYFVLYLFLLLGFFAAPNTADSAPDSDKFFSYERLILNQRIEQNIPKGTEVERELGGFFTAYNKALDAANSEDLGNAKINLQTARKIWPEYFGTDFLLALIYEKEADYKEAARYYKSYLNKLRAFHSGRYRISSSLIQSISVERIETYEDAYKLVKQRLGEHDIDIDKVMPIFTFPVFILPSLVVVFLIGAYIIFFQWLIPYFRRRYMIKHPPQGFWACRKCLHSNPLLRNECEECGEINE